MTTTAENPESEGDLPFAPDERAQYRINETICLKLNDLEYRVDDLELWKKACVTKQPGIKKEARK
ncbi:MAG: hypothetical protein STSR0009_32040 [Methanoregula sp.]